MQMHMAQLTLAFLIFIGYAELKIPKLIKFCLNWQSFVMRCPMLLVEYMVLKLGFA